MTDKTEKSKGDLEREIIILANRIAENPVEEDKKKLVEAMSECLDRGWPIEEIRRLLGNA